VPPFEELTAPVVFTKEPPADTVTLNCAVQEELAGIDAPVSVKSPVPEPPAKVAPEQVELSFVGLAMVIFVGKVSLTLTEVSVVLVLGLLKVRVTVDVPPELMEVGLNALVIVGGPRIAMLVLTAEVKPVPEAVSV